MKLSIKELSKYLDLPTNTLERWIRQGRIPVRKSGSTCLFKESVLKKWAETHNISFPMPDDEKEQQGLSPRLDSLLAAMKFGRVHYHLKGKNVSVILKKAVEEISFLDRDDKDVLFEELIERERLTSTGIGKGVAIPHQRTPQLNTLDRSAIATCFLESPADFNAIDGKPVFVLFLLVSTSIKAHLHLLSRLSFCLRDSDFLEFLRGTPKDKDLFKKITEFEKQFEKAGRT